MDVGQSLTGLFSSQQQQFSSFQFNSVRIDSGRAGEHSSTNISMQANTHSSMQQSMQLGQSIKNQPAEFINSQINQHLGQTAINSPNAALTNYAPEISPQSVADSVLQHISARLQQESDNGASKHELRQLLREAREGIKQGLHEAKDILKENGLFSGDVKDTFKETAHLLRDGFKDLRKSVMHPTQPTHPTPPTPGTPDAGDEQNIPDQTTPSQIHEISAQRSIHASDERGITLELMTAEGDKVSLTVHRNSVFDSQESLEANADGFQYQSSQTASSSSVLNFSVEGDLNADELSDITALINDVNDLSGAFFNDSTSAAFGEVLASFGDDDLSTISGFDLNMFHQQIVIEEETYSIVQSREPASAEVANYIQQVEDTAQKHQAQFDERATALLENQSALSLSTQLLSQFIKTDERAAPVEAIIEPAVALIEANAKAA